MSNVFVSYATADRVRVTPLVKAIEAQGFDVWWDRDISYGESYHRVIEQALERAACAVVVWTRNSVASEWVTNEASEARRRGILVPLLLDDVEPPLEFRHLQSARLLDWAGAPDDPSVQQLITAVRRVVARGSTPAPTAVERPVVAPVGKSWWETPAGWAVGAAALLMATGFFLLTLRGAWPTGGDEPAAAAVFPGANRPAAPATTIGTALPAGIIDLLDRREGAQIVASSEAGWKDYIYGREEPYCSVISTNGFVTFAFRDERPARFDRLGIFIEAASPYNVKTVELYASTESDRGPFQRVGTFPVPNFRNERQPFHEFAFEPVTARYVKLVALDWQNIPGGPNGNVCTMRLMGSLQ